MKYIEDKKLQEFNTHCRKRLVVGEFRYGPSDPTKSYDKRLSKELAAYQRTGNREHLYNIANYAFLEAYWSSRPTVHDATVPSVTRRKTYVD